MKNYISIIILFLCTVTSAQKDDNISFFPSGLEDVVVMQPTGKMINDLPEMVIISDTTQLQRKVNDIVGNSFVKDMLQLYFLATTYLKNKNELSTIEPAYLALSKNDGGYAKVGFHLLMESGHIEKVKVPYIDIVEGRIDDNHDRLMSITQLYPHEMGHLIYGLLNHNKGTYSSRSVDMHYFSVRTDYSTAFNEGFAEHIENVSRIFEKNEAIKNGVFADIENVKIRSESAINGFEKDFLNPFRIGYFKISMPIWYQKYENLKRYEHAINGSVKFLNSTLELDNIEDQITIRNAGIRQNKSELRNYVQMLSTEGVISSFFTHLTQSEVADHYLDTSFYKPFLLDTTAIFSPKEIFTPVQNQFLKYFSVFHEHMSSENTTRSEFIDFMDGYIRAFPSEELAIKKIFKDVTDLEYTSNLPPELWLLVKNHSHRMLVPDSYGAITIPVYTFDLNASEVEDLLTIKGLKNEDAIKIIEHRKANGFFNDLNQIKKIEDLSNESIELILNSEFDEKYMEEVSMPELNILPLIVTPLKHLIFRLMAYFVVIFGLIYLLFLRKEKPAIKRTLSISLIYLSQWIVFVLGGLIFVTLSGNPWQFLALMSVFFLFLNVLFNRKTKIKRNRSLFATCLMGLLVLLSLV
ncbi:MAG: helix-hairpin-helix domain-containing protein [Bacteroidetes bacterium]|nr:helix-hairpin-helix domain-containing protein [Bacteroidota bacterium]